MLFVAILPGPKLNPPKTEFIFFVVCLKKGSYLRIIILYCLTKISILLNPLCIFSIELETVLCLMSVIQRQCYVWCLSYRDRVMFDVCHTETVLCLMSVICWFCWPVLNPSQNIKKKEYGCTEAFLADAKWILHNCIVFNGGECLALCWHCNPDDKT